MNTSTLTKNLSILAVALLMTALLCSEASARSGGYHSHYRDNSGYKKGAGYSHNYNYVRVVEPAFFGFRIGDVAISLPLGYQVVIDSKKCYYRDGRYYKIRPDGYIIIR